MSWLEQYRASARYNQWMNEKLFAQLAELSDGDRKRDQGAFFGSIHGTLNHILLADRAWMLRFTRGDERYVSLSGEGKVIPIVSLDQVLYEDFDELREQRARTDAHILEWTDDLSTNELSGNIAYRASSGEYEHPMWWAVGHLFNHQTHHRGQVTTLLKQLGHDPGVTDLAVFLRG